jgi:hypothetical protein
MAKAEFIANIDTDVPVSRSVDHIRQLVERFQAKEFRTTYGPNGVAVSVRFTITDPHLPKEGDHDGLFTVELTALTDVIHKELVRRRTRWIDADARARIDAQAQRVAWRQLHDIIRATLIGVRSGIMTMGEAFFANLIVTGPDGQERRMANALMESRLLSPRNGRLMLSPSTTEPSNGG